MTRLRTALRRRVDASSDAGLTLAELMVTLVLMGILGTMMLGATVMVSRTVTNAQASGDSLDIAWLKDDSAEDAADLPEPAVLAREAIDDLSGALTELEAILLELGEESEL